MTKLVRPMSVKEGTEGNSATLAHVHSFTLACGRAAPLQGPREAHGFALGGCFSEVLLRYERLPFASQSVRLAVVRHGRRHESNPV